MNNNFPNYSESRAILIGVSVYQDSWFTQVPAAVNSLRGMYEILTDESLCGWPKEQVSVIENPEGASKLGQQLRRLADRTRGVLFLYFVGHGFLTPRAELCLALTDTDAHDPDFTGLEYEKVKRIFLGCDAAVKIAMLDCCYSGRAIETLANTDQQAADATDIRGVYTLTAADGPAHVVSHAEQASACTSFTGEFLNLIRNGAPGGPRILTLGDLYVELRRRLRARSLPAPHQRGVDSVHRLSFAWNASFADVTQNTGAAKDYPLLYAQALEALDWETSMNAVDQESVDRATQAAKEAVFVYRELAEQDPEKYEPFLERALETHSHCLDVAMVIYRNTRTTKIDDDGRRYGETGENEDVQLEADRQWFSIAEKNLSSLRAIVYVTDGFVNRVREVYGVDQRDGDKVSLRVGAPLTQDEIVEIFPKLPVALSRGMPPRRGKIREYIRF